MLTKAIQQKNLLLSIISHDVRDSLLNIKTLLDNLSYTNLDLAKRKFDKIVSDLDRRVDNAGYELDNYTTLPDNHTFVNEKSDNSGLIGAQKIIEENGGQLITHSKNYNGTVWEIRINKQNVL